MKKRLNRCWLLLLTGLIWWTGCAPKAYFDFSLGAAEDASTASNAALDTAVVDEVGAGTSDKATDAFTAGLSLEASSAAQPVPIVSPTIYASSSADQPKTPLLVKKAAKRKGKGKERKGDVSNGSTGLGTHWTSTAGQIFSLLALISIGVIFYSSSLLTIAIAFVAALGFSILGLLLSLSGETQARAYPELYSLRKAKLSLAVSIAALAVFALLILLLVTL